MKNRRCNLKRWINNALIWATNLLYHQLAWSYDAVAWMVSFGHWQEWRHHGLDHIKPGHTLEVGFGTGELLLTMAELGINVIGLDRSTQMQNVVKRKVRRKGYQNKRVQSCVEAIPFSGQVFDNVISTFPSGYILKEETLKEVLRVLKVNGRMVVVGLYVIFKPALLKWLTHWYLGAGGDTYLTDFTLRAEQIGFNVSVIQHETKRYRLPILILERGNDQ